MPSLLLQQKLKKQVKRVNSKNSIYCVFLAVKSDCGCSGVASLLPKRGLNKPLKNPAEGASGAKSGTLSPSCSRSRSPYFSVALFSSIMG